MNKKVLIAFLAIVSLLTGCNNTNKENTETGIRQVENKDTKISKIKKNPSRFCKKLRRRLENLPQPQFWSGKHGFNKYR